MPLALEEPGEAVRVCDRHGCTLIVTERDELRCPREPHDVRTWLVVRHGRVLNTGSVSAR